MSDYYFDLLAAKIKADGIVRESLAEFFRYASKSEYVRVHRLIVDYAKSIEIEGVLKEKLDEGYTLESVCRAYSCSYLDYWFSHEPINTKLAENIPDFELFKKYGMSGLLL